MNSFAGDPVGPVPQSWTIRKGEPADLTAICALFSDQLGREPDVPLIRNALLRYPSVVSSAGGRIIGFAYCGYMAPDLVELMNIVVSKEHRSHGIGSRLLELLEQALAPIASAVMLTNSTLHTAPGKHPATRFYVRNGYALVASTGVTNLFWKEL